MSTDNVIYPAAFADKAVVVNKRRPGPKKGTVCLANVIRRRREAASLSEQQQCAQKLADESRKAAEREAELQAMRRRLRDFVYELDYNEVLFFWSVMAGFQHIPRPKEEPKEPPKPTD